MVNTINIGGQTAAIIQFILFMGLLQPAIAVATPPAFQHQFYGTVNAVILNYTNNVQIPLAQQANSSSGFNAINPGNLVSFGGLSFVYGAFSSFMSSIYNYPRLLLWIFSTGLAYSPVVYTGIGIIALMSICVLGYITVVNIYIGISLIMKGSVQEGG